MANRKTLSERIVDSAYTGKSDPTELSVLDDVTASATELNLLDGVTATTAEINKLAGAGSILASGTQASKISDPSATVEITYTSGTAKTTVGSQTIADRTTPTDAELMDTVDELNAALAALDTKIVTIIDALEAFGISASS